MKNKKAFTLLELLIVVVILGILAAIALPMYTNAVEKRRGEACINNIRIILAAWRIYNLNNGVWNPASLQNISQINQRLGINIEERNFGTHTTIGQPRDRFYMSYAQTLPRYYIAVYRISGRYQDRSILCFHYPNANGPDSLTLDWAGTWPWLPADE